MLLKDDATITFWADTTVVHLRLSRRLASDTAVHSDRKRTPARPPWRLICLHRLTSPVSHSSAVATVAIAGKMSLMSMS
jgi:hypothetical protein